MSEFYERLRALPGTKPLDKQLLEEYTRAMEEQVIPEIVRAEEAQRLVAAEARMLPVSRSVPQAE